MILHSLCNRLLGFGDPKGLMEELKAIKGSDAQQKELMQKMSKGQFTLR